MKKSADTLKAFLDARALYYEQPGFIADDPISVPHSFSKQQDIEIAGFFAAILAWGNRKSIINSCKRLLELMDNAPYDFIMHFTEADLKPFLKFVHRTFNAIDLFHFLDVLQHHYKIKKLPSLETAFSNYLTPGDTTIEKALIGFRRHFFDDKIFPHYPVRTQKHIATPERKSACKRLNMYLRWMVRSSSKGVDFGLWKNIQPLQLICPLDLHVARVARHFKLLDRPNNDWQAALELTTHLKQLDAADPVKYDFALFGLGVIEKF
ncbi:TIGR02757 family protein [Niabella ginsenosidivorans]|uniref:TIGR02757 family protein n=1 Tax=Niabella ginsenosidivorans TaxID=1176587 RepID=A0A1A9I8F0_9BACT|nr:TIGR02757 family protein [Niabella ginsenosidivorans]ANH83349.1 TIGR02757 family protein [Niabella ginsenosidivorans]